MEGYRFAAADVDAAQQGDVGGHACILPGRRGAQSGPDHGAVRTSRDGLGQQENDQPSAISTIEYISWNSQRQRVRRSFVDDLAKSAGTNLRRAKSMLTLPPNLLSGLANPIAAKLTSVMPPGPPVTVDVSGTRGHGRRAEWTEDWPDAGVEAIPRRSRRAEPVQDMREWAPPRRSMPPVAAR